MFRQLPQELWKEVFLCIENNSDFSSASRVCKSWHSVIYNKKFLQQLVKVTLGTDMGETQEFPSYIDAYKVAKKFNKFDDILWNCVHCKSAPRAHMSAKVTLPSSPTLLEKYTYYSSKIPRLRNGIPFRDEMLIFWCGCKYDIGNN
jgi:hypothetical protein